MSSTISLTLPQLRELLFFRNDISMQSNEYEIVDFIMNRFKAYMGIGQAKRSKKLKNIVNKKLEFDPDEYIEGLWTFQYTNMQ